MTFYHILLEIRNQEKPIIRFDLTDLSVLLTDFVKPFITKSKQIITNGNILNPEEIKAILIRSSDIDKNSMVAIERIRLKQEQENAARKRVFMVGFGLRDSQIFYSRNTIDITEEVFSKAQNEEAPLRIEENNTKHDIIMHKNRRYFISHSTNDQAYAKLTVQMLEAMGIPSTDIFCSSLEGNSIPIGKSWKEKLHYELNENTFVIFLLSNNFYNSPVCLCEMGAAWILSQEHAPILIPPMDYNELKGIIDSQGFIINEPLKWTQLRTQLNQENENSTIWERKRNDLIQRFDALINS